MGRSVSIITEGLLKGESKAKGQKLYTIELLYLLIITSAHLSPWLYRNLKYQCKMKRPKKGNKRDSAILKKLLGIVLEIGVYWPACRCFLYEIKI